MGLISDYENIDLGRTLKQYKDQFLSNEEQLNYIISELTNAGKPYGIATAIISHNEQIISRLQQFKIDHPGHDTEIDAIISLATTKLNTMKNDYTTQIYNVLQGI